MYRSVNVASSAISSCHPKIDSCPVSQHPLLVQLLNGMLLHERVQRKYSANTRPSAVPRFHHKLGEVHPSSHSVINISGPLHRFTDNVTQSPREKDPEHTEQMSNSHPQSHIISSRSGKPHSDIGSIPPWHLASPSTLQRIINTAHKTSKCLLRQLHGTRP